MKIKPDLKISERTIVSGLIVVFSITIVTISLFGDKGLLELRALQSKEQSLQDEIRDIREQQAIWQTRLASMQDNPTYIENIAREKLGFVRENEIIFSLDDVPDQ